MEKMSNGSDLRYLYRPGNTEFEQPYALLRSVLRRL